MESGSSVSPNRSKSPSKSDPAVREQAMHWLVRKLNPADWTAEDELNLQAWIRLRPEHHDEYIAAQATLALMSQPGVFDADEVASVLNRSAPPTRNHPSRRQWLGLAAAAAVALAAIGAWVAFSGPPAYATGIAQTRQITLPDGTHVHLDALTTLQYESSSASRSVRLQQGTAVFEVAPNRVPFQVEAANWTVKDIGTTFQVQLRTAGTGPAVEVSVAEGEVELASTQHAQTGPVRLTAGEETTWSAGLDHPSSKSRTGSGSDFASWREGRLRYRNRPLSQVLADLQRYQPERLILTDTGLGSLTVTGTISTRDTDRAFATLEQVLPVKITRTSGGDVQIAPR